MKKQDLLWEKMNKLIENSNIPESERVLFVKAREELDKGTIDQTVAAHLKSKLSFLSFKKPLSKETVAFFKELSRLYLGFGRRDNISF
ncbi:bacteriocin immunity protein [Liquorilactobacillus satsumensis]|uniref:bacteriocin immunity protein n=1 Tax=Liquorilactobacillus TaxID=2767888 RepID=UPI001E4AD91B|nr:bacteriocin immunity protein [Liquorilactobacillus satsumensis]MCC7666658.1 hypothetical protein [Liquorilactobacillus satsumensis]